MRLIDDLAARRLYYQRSLPTLPDILLIDIPPGFAGRGLALDRYYPVILESLAELQEFEAFLCEMRSAPVAPSLFDRRPSSLQIEDILVARYEPQAPDWPWLMLCCWPKSHTSLTDSPADSFARGAYTIDAFVSAQDMEAAELKLLATLRPHELRLVRSVPTIAGRA
ncbi:hypothetical protein [Sphingobium scionense]|jgi:hypothetical protein|uniref:Uncharacterized protein n=1 Tax=Sphingobium scionense TaxID=1404341 RepID=A0A7W6PZ00_9SPHN|nr:hypothetical protein [Sphingobium scionense]MBB4150510.1 hypothetical protein [Sphingobium scionense]